MRTTLTIDDELLAAARSLARDKSESVGRAVCDLTRRGMNATPQVNKADRNPRFPAFSVPRDAHPITLTDVRRAEDEP